MISNSWARWIALAGFGMAALVSGTLHGLRAHAQAPAKEAPQSVPRTADGEPDLSGIWVRPVGPGIRGKYDESGGEQDFAARDGNFTNFKVGPQLFSGDYAGYQDYQDYGVMFPSHIVQKIDGRVVADLTVTQALANPYLIFPPPKELKAP